MPERETIYVCLACGKTSNDKYGKVEASHGWDESCYINSILCYKDKLVLSGRRVKKIEEGGVVEEE